MTSVLITCAAASVLAVLAVTRWSLLLAFEAAVGFCVAGALALFHWRTARAAASAPRPAAEPLPPLTSAPVGPETPVAVGAVPAPTEATPQPPVGPPYSVEPAVVLMSLYDAVAARYVTCGSHLWLQDDSSATLRLVAAFGPSVPDAEPVPQSDPILGAAARLSRAVFDRMSEDSLHPERSGRWRYALPVGTPTIRGVAAVDISATEDQPSVQTLNEISSVLRGSLTAALAVDVAHSEMRTAQLLLQAAQELAAGSDREEMLGAALERAMEVAGASTGSVMLPDAQTGDLHIVASRGLPDDVVASARLALGEAIAGKVFESASPTMVEDLPGQAGERRHGVLSAVSVPIADAQGALGVINVGSRSFPARLTDAYVRALEILGAQTALAMRNADAAQRSWDLYLENLQALADALEEQDPYRRGASRRIAQLSVALARLLGMDEEHVVSVRIAAILHDVGMGLATGSVGATARPMSTVDRGLVRSHPKLASDVLLRIPALEELAPLVRHHHERFDGAGYDTGLSGTAIPLGSRILAVTDAFVAMTSPRPYRQALETEEALNELSATSGSQFDPEVVEAFRRLLAENPDLALKSY